MGLDQYAYVAMKDGAREDYYEGQGEWVNGDYVVPEKTKPLEIAYWRKHPNLHGWMERLWLKKLSIPHTKADQFIQNILPPREFNGVELELTWDDLDQLEKDILARKMSKLDTQGFFFGTPSDDYYKEKDLEFIKEAKSHLFMGLKVFYNSSW